mgnify:FL=1|jgi:poly(ribitol-phosphate) beta-N-acetylglucosaminyltransferase
MKNKDIVFFSIIMPVYNSEKYLYESINSALSQKTKGRFLYELILVDDLSTDKSVKIAETFFPKSRYYIMHTSKNCGPGCARNIGVDRSIGKYILFLDSDDCLSVNALNKLYDILELNNFYPDLVSYNWRYLANRYIKGKEKSGGRRDISCLLSSHNELINNYLSMKMDGSVIYTLVRKTIIINNHVKFDRGFHEDISYILKLYCFSGSIKYLNDEIYYKRQHPLSIINSITEKHILGYMGAWREIFDFIFCRYNGKQLEEYIISFKSGLTGAIGVLIICIFKFGGVESMTLYRYLYLQYTCNFTNDNMKCIYPLPNKTGYDQLSNCFINTMKLYDYDKAIVKIPVCINKYNKKIPI